MNSSRNHIPDNRTSETEILAPTLRVPAVEERLERDLRFGVETVVAEQTMVRGQRKDDLGRTGDEVAARLLDLDCAKKPEQDDQHDAMCELGLVVESVDFAAVLWDGSERQDVVEIQAESRVDVVDERLNVLLRALIEGNNGECGALAAEALEDALVVLHRCPAVTRRRDHDVSTACQEALEDLDTDRPLAYTGE